MDEPVYKLLLEIHKEMGIIKSDIAKMEVDLREHMRRTAVAEDRIDRLSEKHSAEITKLQKGHYMVQGALALITLIGVIVSIYTKLF